MNIPYENLKLVNCQFEDKFKNEFKIFLDDGFYVLGNKLETFESSFSEYLNVKHCIGVNSGLDALVISLIALFGENSKYEVIVPSNTYIATILSIIRAGCVPVLVEPDINTYNIDVTLVESLITPKTKAIMPVHLYGLPCDMDILCQIAKKNGLRIIEDCAQSHGAKYKNKFTGTFDIGCFSFYPTKNLGALGDGGCICSDDTKFIEKVKALRNYGSQTKYQNIFLGVNSRLDVLQAHFLSIKLPYLDAINNHRRKIANIYNSKINCNVIKPIYSESHVYHIYNLRSENRDSLRKFLLSRGIGTEIHYPIAPHNQVAYKQFITGNFPVSELIHNTTISLPVSTATSFDQAEYVCDSINEWSLNES